MIRFEIKKIFSKTANKIGLIVLSWQPSLLLAILQYLPWTMWMRRGDTHTGIAAAKVLA